MFKVGDKVTSKSTGQFRGMFDLTVTFAAAHDWVEVCYYDIIGSRGTMRVSIHDIRLDNTPLYPVELWAQGARVRYRGCVYVVRDYTTPNPDGRIGNKWAEGITVSGWISHNARVSLVVDEDDDASCKCGFGRRHLPMRKRRIYLAGKMSGVPYFNFPVFHRAAAKLRADGHYVFNPAEADIDRIGVDPSLDNPTGCVKTAAERHGLSRRECLAEDLSWIALEADAIAVLPDWQGSKGVEAELALARALDLEIIWL